MRVLSVFICITLFCSSITSQEVKLSISGQIKNTNNETISSASISIYSPNSVLPIYVSLSNKSGNYYFTNVKLTDSLALIFSCLGYSNKLVKLYKTDSLKEFIKVDVVLTPQIISLPSISVESRKAISTHGDTTLFNANKFGSETENKVEDLLKNLPGMQVDEDGGLKFKNKPIAKVLIEGDDLFGKNYKMLTQSLSANFLDEIQAIENDSENPVLKNFDFNKQTVLNLRLKKQFLFKIFGETTPLIGIDTLVHDINSNIFSLLNHFKFSIISNFNNIGKDLGNKVSFDQTKIGNPFSSNSITIPESKEIELIKIPKYFTNNLVSSFLNNDKNISANFINRLSPKMDIKGDVSYTTVSDFQNQNNSISYLNSNNFQLSESNFISTSTRQLNSGITFTYANSDKERFEGKFSNYTLTEILSSKTVNNGQDFQQSQNSSHDTKNILLKFTKAITSSKVFEVESVYHSYKSPIIFSKTPFTDTSFLGITTGFRNYLYNYDNPISFFSVLAKLYNNSNSSYSLKNQQNELLFGISNSNQSIDSWFAGSNSIKPEEFASNQFKNLIKYLENKYWISDRITKTIRKFTFILNSEVSFIKQVISDSTNKRFHADFTKIQTRMSGAIKKTFKGTRYLEVGYTYNSSLSPITDIYNSYQIRDYRNFMAYQFDSLNLLANKNKFTFQYNNFNIGEGKIFILSGSYLFGKNNSMYNYDYGVDHTVQTRVPYISNSKTINFLITYERALTKLNCYLTLRNFFMYYDFFTGSLVKPAIQKSINLDQEISMRSVFTKQFNFKLGAIYSFIGQSSELNSNNNTQIRINVEPNLQFNRKKASIKLNYQYLLFNANVTQSHFLSFESSYSIKKNRFRFILQGRNLLNSNRIEILSTTVEYINRQTFRIQPFQIMGGFKVQF